MKLLGMSKKKIQLLCDECYSLMSKYSKLKDEWEFASKLDIKEVDEKVLQYLKKYPILAVTECKMQIPLILFCVECGMINCVKWYIKEGKDLNIADDQTDNIALYAYKFDIPELLAYCAKNIELASYKNKNGISLSYLLERDKKRIEAKERAKKQIVPRSQCRFKEMEYSI